MKVILLSIVSAALSIDIFWLHNMESIKNLRIFAIVVAIIA